MFNSYTKRPPSEAEAKLWHLRMGYLGPEFIAQLIKRTEGVRIKGPSTTECDVCGTLKGKQQIRREPREIRLIIGERIAIDFLDI